MNYLGIEPIRLCERSEAIQLHRRLDCFALLAMTNGGPI
jgi:hypothetical protein